MAEWRFSQVAGSLVVAHRGASRELPENTLAAFERAVVVGADAIEFDVRMTLDDVAIVVHDPDVSRTTDGTGYVHEMPLHEVKRMHIHGGHEVPTLTEVLALVSGRAGVDIEIKNLPGEPGYEPGRERAVGAALAAVDAVGFVGPVLISSFSPTAIAASARLRPDIPTGLLTAWSVPARDALRSATLGGHGWVLPSAGMVAAAGEGFAAEVHEVGLRLGVWIVDDPDEAVALMRAGVDAVATNDPVGILAARRRATGG